MSQLIAIIGVAPPAFAQEGGGGGGCSAAEFYAANGREKEAREIVDALLARRATMPSYQKRGDRPWLNLAKTRSPSGLGASCNDSTRCGVGDAFVDRYQPRSSARGVS